MSLIVKNNNIKMKANHNHFTDAKYTISVTFDVAVKWAVVSKPPKPCRYTPLCKGSKRCKGGVYLYGIPLIYVIIRGPERGGSSHDDE